MIRAVVRLELCGRCGHQREAHRKLSVSGSHEACIRCAADAGWCDAWVPPDDPPGLSLRPVEPVPTA